MKKSATVLIVISILIVAVILGIGIYKFNFTNDDIYIQGGDKINSKDATYRIEGESVTLKDGVAENSAVDGAVTKIITRYFGNDASGDLNGDGKDDKAFLLTQDGGGSGTFFYVAVALAADNGYQGINAILLGDRIAPQTTEIKDGKVVVNYADRKADEPMTAQPSVGVSKYFQVVNNQLVEQLAAGWKIFQNEKYGIKFQYPEYLDFKGDETINAGEAFYTVYANYDHDGDNYFNFTINDKASSGGLSQDIASGQNIHLQKEIKTPYGKIYLRDGIGTINYYFMNAYFEGKNYNYKFLFSRPKYSKEMLELFEKIISTAELTK